MSIIKVKTGGITADAITDALIADDVVGTEHLTANEVDTTALKGDAVTGAELADDAVNSEHYTDGSVDTAHIADAQITTAKLSTAVFTGATDIGADLADADLILVDDGAGGTIRKAALSRIKTYTGGGKIGQVIADIDTSSRTTTSTSFVTASSSANVDITPSASSSKIYVVVTGNFQCNDGNDGWCASIFRGNTNLGNGTSGLASGNSIPGVTTVNFPTTMALLDSPNTTSQITYQLYVKVIDADGDGGNVNIGNTVSGSGNPVPTLITVFEVLA